MTAVRQMLYDNYGALSRIGPEQRKHAMSLIKRCDVFDIAMELNAFGPQGNPNQLEPFRLQWRTVPDTSVAADNTHQFAAETISGSLHIGTHIDGLAHIAANGYLHGHHAVHEVMKPDGFSVNGIEKLPPIITRAIILDIAGLHQTDRLEDGYEITVADVNRALDGAQLNVEQGDAVLLRTGKIDQFFKDPTAYVVSQPGIGVDAACWLYDCGISILGTDTTGSEPIPFVNERYTTHRAMLVDRGVLLLENLNLDDVTREHIPYGALFCLPLKITGATGSWVRPIIMC